MSEHFQQVDVRRLRNGHGAKWGMTEDGVIPAWVADMDFGIPPAVEKAIHAVASAQDLGYPYWPDGDPIAASFQTRMKKLHGWEPELEGTRIYSDLIQVLQVMIEHSTSPGDGIAIHVPTYPPFLASIHRSGRRLIPLPMKSTDEGWQLESEAELLGRLAESGCRMMILVNPQNPSGRVFTPDELSTIANVAEQLDLVVFSDEIHAELAYEGRVHTPFASLRPDTARRTITATSPTKTFNIAGIRVGVAHIGCDSVLQRLDDEPLDYFGQPSNMSRAAAVAAWEQSDEWLRALKGVLSENRELVSSWAEGHSDRIAYSAPEAGYLAWFDFTRAGNSGQAPADYFETMARVKLSPGAEFSQFTGVDTESFARLNFATSRSNLLEVLSRLDRALTPMRR
jgi:cysteine-S-conjugate beta-lyase